VLWYFHHLNKVRTWHHLHNFIQFHSMPRAHLWCWIGKSAHRWINYTAKFGNESAFYRYKGTLHVLNHMLLSHLSCLIFQYPQFCAYTNHETANHFSMSQFPKVQPIKLKEYWLCVHSTCWHFHCNHNPNPLPQHLLAFEDLIRPTEPHQEVDNSNYVHLFLSNHLTPIDHDHYRWLTTLCLSSFIPFMK